ncbi:MAG: filamentous hemagglutinin N-terminal domain-containing protein, partial [Gammaproteobacteria bacterium]|nr:filamentous hemagglutinin N-terminal domain-containing protein [Gammaproteobacteria bacterium]
MDRNEIISRVRRNSILLAFSLAFLSTQALAAGVEADGATDTGVDRAANGVAIVNIANPNKQGLSHNKYRQFNVEKSGLILNNSKQNIVDTQLGGKIIGNARLKAPARVILNEVTSTHPSALRGYTEVAGQRADIVIANPNGISINGAGFINSSRVTLTTGIPKIDAPGNLVGFDVRRGSITIEGSGLNTQAQDATSIYSHFLTLNASLHARDLDVALGLNQIDYPGRKIVSSRNSGAQRVLLDTSLLGGMYANKIVLVGTDKGLGMNLPAQVIASMGDIEISADGRLRLRQLDAGGDIRLQSAQAIDSHASVYAAGNVEMISADRVTLESGMIAARSKLSIEANQVNNNASLVAGRNTDGFQNDWGDLSIQSQRLVNTGELIASNRLDLASDDLLNQGLIGAASRLQVDAGSIVNEASMIAGLDAGGSLNSRGKLVIRSQQLINAGELVAGKRLDLEVSDLMNQGLINAARHLQVDADTLVNDATLFSGGNMRLQVRDRLLNPADGVIFTVDDLLFAADEEYGKTAQITNDLGLIQSLQGDIDIYATRFDNLGVADISYKKIYYDLGNGREVSSAGEAMNINLAYSSGYTKHKSKARKRWVDNVLERLQNQAPLLYAANEAEIRQYRSTRFDAIETRLVDQSTTTPAYLDSGKDLNLHVDVFTNQNSVAAAAGNIHFDVTGDYRNIAATVSETVTDYQYYSFADHKRNWRSKDKYTSKGHSGYVPVTRTKYVSANTVTQAGGGIDGKIGGQAVNSGVLSGKYVSTAAAAPAQFDKLDIKVPKNDFGLFVRATAPGSRYLIETNPRFTDFGNFINSSYLLERLDYSPGLTLKRLGDAFYESKLIRDRIFALTGRRYLDASLTDDNLQFQYLMDNAIVAQKSLNLAPGVALSRAQINRLTRDIVWLEQKRIDGEDVLVPTVYLANGPRMEVRGGRIISGADTRLQVAALANSGLIESGASLDIDAADEIENQGLLIAGDDLRLAANNDIANVSGRIEADSVDMTSYQGDIINRRASEAFNYSRDELSFSSTLYDAAAVISASDSVKLDAAGEIQVEGSAITGRDIKLDASSVTIETAAKSERFDAGGSDDYFKESSTVHFASEIDGKDIVILSSGKTRVAGSVLNATDELKIKSASIAIDAVEESDYLARLDSRSELFSESVNSKKSFRSSNIGSQLAAATVVLITEQGDIELTGSEIIAGTRLAMNSAQDIRIHAGEESRFDESYEHKTSWLSGGALYTETEDLQGEASQTAVTSKIVAGAVDLEAAGEIELVGVEVEAAQSFQASAQDISVRNANNEVTQYSKHTEIRVGLDDMVSSITDLDELVSLEDGQLKLKLGEGVYERAESVTTQTSVVASQVQAGSLQFNATNGDIQIEGSDFLVDDAIELNASGDIALLDAGQGSTTESSRQEGTAELSITVQNEYDQAVRAIEDVKDAKQDLSQANSDYDRYRTDLAAQEAELERLRQQVAEGEGFVEQADIDDFERRLQRMRGDKKFYRANIALAVVTLTSKVTALIEQGARAAASSATYGFNASLALDVDVVERRINEYYGQSRATNLSAGSIDINAGDTAFLRGANLYAAGDIDIDADDIKVLAGINASQRFDASQHLEFSYRWDLLGANSSIDPRSLGGSVGGDDSRSEDDAGEYVNSSIQATNIRLNAAGDATIKGADIAAAEKLEISAENLEIASLQDYTFNQTRSRGLSYSGEGAGVNNAKGDNETIRTRVTQLRGQQVDISVADHTELQAAVVAAVDADGVDNGQLSLTTNTLRASSLYNTVNNEGRSLDLQGGDTVGLDYQDDAEYGKTKSLATLGSGDIQIDDAAGSDTRYLNTDITDTEVSIYDIESHRGLAGELDIRLLSEEGRKEIAEETRRTALMGSTIADVVAEDSVILTDLFQHIGDVQKDLDVQKLLATRDEGLNAHILNSLETATPTEKQQALDAFARAYADVYEISIESANLIAIDRFFAGSHYATESSSSQIFVNDMLQSNALDYAKTLGHEVTHAQISQETIRDRGDELNEAYSDLRGEYSAGNYEFSFSTNNLGGVQTGDTNLHVDRDTSKIIQNNNQAFQEADQNNLEFRQLHSIEAKLIAVTANAFAIQQEISTDEAIARLGNQAMRQIDSNHDDGDRDLEAQTWLQNLTVAFLNNGEGEFEVEQFAASQRQKEDHTLFAEHQDAVEGYLGSANNLEVSGITEFINEPDSEGTLFVDTNYARLNAIGRVETRNYAFGAGEYGEGDIIYGYLGADNQLYPMESVNAYQISNAIVLNPTDIGFLLDGNLGANGLSLEYSAAVQGLGINTALINRDSNNGVAGLFTAPGQNDVLREAIRYTTGGSPTPLLVFNNGNTRPQQVFIEVNRELGSYLADTDRQFIESDIRESAPGDLLDFSAQMEIVTAQTLENNSSFLSDFDEHVQNSEGIGAAVTGYWTGVATNIGLNWELLATDDHAPQYLVDSAKSGVALDILAIAPLLKGVAASTPRIGTSTSVSDLSINSGFRELKSVGADGAVSSLPNGYRHVASAEGEVLIMGPRGGIYTSTDYTDQLGNPL